MQIGSPGPGRRVLFAALGGQSDRARAVSVRAERNTTMAYPAATIPAATRSANAAIVSDGFAPTAPGITEPSQT